MKYLCIIQARLNSSRLPAKVMLDLAGKTLLERVYETVSKSKKIEQIVVATSNQKSDNIIEKKLLDSGINCFRGDLDNVLKRFANVVADYPAEHIVRVTADNPLMDGNIIDSLIEYYEKNNVDYSMFSNGIYGLSAEVFSYEALIKANVNARDDFDREHVTPYIKDNCKVSITNICKQYNRPDLRVTVDTLSDYINMQNFYLDCKSKKLKADIQTFVYNAMNI